MKFHDIANVFPMLPQAELAALAADIKANGLHHPITTLDGKVLDGRNRYSACVLAEIEPRFEEYTGDNPLAFVISENIARRHLNESQRAMCAARLANMGEGRPGKTTPIGVVSQPASAELLNVSCRSVQRANTVIENGVPELVAACDAGQVAVSVAAKIADLPKSEQKAIAKRIKNGDKPADAIREVKREEKRAELDNIAAKEVKATEGVFDVIVIDPPWPMQKIDRDVTPTQVEFEYPTMTIEKISAQPIPCADDCHVWLWTTQRFLPQAFVILEAWGLTYVCAFVWHKPGGFQPFNLPQYNCEFAIYARKGAPQFLDTKDLPLCFSAGRGAHSEKPEEFYAMVRRVTAGRRLDMFNRREIEGFETWGNEA